MRPNTIFPTVAAQQLATLDQFSNGRAVVHIISGGSDAEQARQGDFLTKDERYDRSAEWIEHRPPLVDRAGGRSATTARTTASRTSARASSRTAPIPISVGGSSDAAYRVGGALGDIFGLWGEPLADTREQIARVDRERASPPAAPTPRASG